MEDVKKYKKVKKFSKFSYRNSIYILINQLPTILFAGELLWSI